MPAVTVQWNSCSALVFSGVKNRYTSLVKIEEKSLVNIRKKERVEIELQKVAAQLLAGEKFVEVFKSGATRRVSVFA